MFPEQYPKDWRTSASEKLSKKNLLNFPKYIPHEHLAWDFGPQFFPSDQVQAIAIFDIRLLNSDRHFPSVPLFSN